ncbi:MAG: STAS domain-containing protein [Planctomycetota bacterium]
MNLPTEIFEGVVVAHAPDELVHDQAAALASFLTGLERRKVVFDLDRAELIESECLEAILTAQEELRAKDGDLKIAVSNPTNRTILEVTRLNEQLEVFESLVDAVRSFR